MELQGSESDRRYPQVIPRFVIPSAVEAATQPTQAARLGFQSRCKPDTFAGFLDSAALRSE